MAPPGARGSVPPGAVLPNEGRFVGVQGAEDILRLPLRRATAPADLDPIRLPSLLMSLGRRKEFCGVLELDRDGDLMRWELNQGTIALDSPRCKDRFLATFLWSEGTYRITTQAVGRHADKGEALAKLVVDGLRWVLRQEQADRLASLLEGKLSLSPTATPRGLALARAVGFWPSESRFLRYQCDGTLTGLEAANSGGIARPTALQLMFLMDALGELTWAPSVRQEGPSLQKQVESRAAEAPHANYFDLLGLHWSVEDRDVEAAHAAMVELYGPSSEAFGVAPDACRQLLSLAKIAYEALGKRSSRIAYLAKIKPDLDFLSLSELLRTRAEAQSLKGDSMTAEASKRLVHDVDPLAQASRRELDLRQLKG